MIKKSNIKDLKIIKIYNFEDNRGSFKKLFSLSSKFKKEKIYQINASFNLKKGTLRGMHFQKPPYSERKIIYCSKGKILDVIVDLRSNSKTFLNIFQIELKENDNIAIDIPRGCCHGFLTLKHKSEMIYIHFDQYNKRKEYPIMYNDPILNINWPIKISNISNKDLSNFYLDNDFKGFKL